MELYDYYVLKLDGLIITARHGDNHYKYAKPYLGDGIPMFIDKPITVSEKDAREFRRELEENRIPVSGGSMCMYDGLVQELKKAVEGSRFIIPWICSWREKRERSYKWRLPFFSQKSC